MKKIAKFLPIEFYFLFIPSLLIFLASSFCLKNFSTDTFSIGNFFQTLGASQLNIALIALITILILGVMFDIFFYFISIRLSPFFKKNTGNEYKATNWKNILSFFLINWLLAFATYSLLLSTLFLFKIADPARTTFFSNINLSWDKAIFNANPGVWLIKIFSGTFIEETLLWVYINIFWVFTFMVLISFFFNRKAFRKFMLSFFISWIIALPLWLLFPALSPDLMFRLDQLHAAGSENYKAFNNFNPSTQLKEKLKHEETVYTVNQDPGNNSLPISTFPSMHAAWGTLIAYSGILICPLLGIILIPLSILNDISAVYILEHFSVDVFLGIIIAIISIIITEILFHFENKYFEDKFGLLSGFGYIQSTLKNIWSTLKNIWTI